jgi:hypothetical protein
VDAADAAAAPVAAAAKQAARAASINDKKQSFGSAFYIDKCLRRSIISYYFHLWRIILWNTFGILPIPFPKAWVFPTLALCT